MTPATQRLCLVGLMGLLALGCAWGVWDSRRAVPEPLLQVSGTVTELRIVQRRGRDDQIYFRLPGHQREFNYGQGLPHVDTLMDQLRVGSQVELQVGPRGNFDLWGLRLDGREMLTPQTRQTAQRGGGYIAAALGLGLLLLARWLWRVMDPAKRR